MSEVNVTEADRHMAAEIVVAAEMRDLIRSGRYDAHPYVQAFAAHRRAALLEGVRLGLEAAGKVVQAAQYDPAPWCKSREIMAQMDPAAIIAARGEG